MFNEFCFVTDYATQQDTLLLIHNLYSSFMMHHSRHIDVYMFVWSDQLNFIKNPYILCFDHILDDAVEESLTANGLNTL